MGFYTGGTGGRQPRGGTADSRTNGCQSRTHENAPHPEGQRAGSASGRERTTTCFGVALVTVTRTGPSLPWGVQICQLSSKQPIILPSTGVRVCLTFGRCNQFGSVPRGKVADLGSHPYGLTGCEVGCLIVDCHRFGWLVTC